MYKALARKAIRGRIEGFSQGDVGAVVARYADGAQLSFPGRNSWAGQHREPPTPAREKPTHVGRDEIEAFVTRYVREGMRMEVDDILVNGPPWNMRAAVRVRHITEAPGEEPTVSRGAIFMTARWGKVVWQEDYEDTQLIAEREGGVQREPA